VYVISFQLSYDYRCPFAKNIHLHVVKALRAGADFDVTFIPWTMGQGHKAATAPDVWDDPTQDSANLALAVSISVRDHQPEYFLDAHDALFRARHEGGIRLSTLEQIDGVLAPLGVDLDRVREDLATRRPFEVLGEHFRSMQRYEAFGVPTFVVNDDATFVRYMKPPTEDGAHSTAIISALVTLMAEQADLNEFKHTKVPL
jgi:protein-disulfide isomerase-like protein with CxxC motif